MLLYDLPIKEKIIFHLFLVFQLHPHFYWLSPQPSSCMKPWLCMSISNLWLYCISLTDFCTEQGLPHCVTRPPTLTVPSSATVTILQLHSRRSETVCHEETLLYIPSYLSNPLYFNKCIKQLLKTGLMCLFVLWIKSANVFVFVYMLTTVCGGSEQPPVFILPVPCSSGLLYVWQVTVQFLMCTSTALVGLYFKYTFQ